MAKEQGVPFILSTEKSRGNHGGRNSGWLVLVVGMVVLVLVVIWVARRHAAPAPTSPEGGGVQTAGSPGTSTAVPVVEMGPVDDVGSGRTGSSPSEGSSTSLPLSASARILLDQGRTLLKQGDVAAATAAFEKVLSSYPGTYEAARAAYQLGWRYASQNKLEEASRLLTMSLDGLTRTEEAQVVPKLEELARTLIFSSFKTERTEYYTVKTGDYLVSIAKQYKADKLSHGLIAFVNGVKNPKSLGVGRRLKIIKGEFRVEISKSKHTLTCIYDGMFMKRYPVGLGKSGLTPSASFEVENLKENPDWYRPQGGVVPFGAKENPLGTRWIGFKDTPDDAGLGIHGNNDPDSIGKDQSEGCIRMHNKDVEELFTLVNYGTRVTIKD